MRPKWNASARARHTSLTSSHAQALPGNPYDGHTLAGVIPAIKQLVGHTIERLHADAGYRGHNAPPDDKLKIYTSKQGHLKNEHRMDRNYLADREGDANNAILAVGLRILWRLALMVLYAPSGLVPA